MALPSAGVATIKNSQALLDLCPPGTTKIRFVRTLFLMIPMSLHLALRHIENMPKDGDIYKHYEPVFMDIPSCFPHPEDIGGKTLGELLDSISKVEIFFRTHRHLLQTVFKPNKRYFTWRSDCFCLNVPPACLPFGVTDQSLYTRILCNLMVALGYNLPFSKDTTARS